MDDIKDHHEDEHASGSRQPEIIDTKVVLGSHALKPYHEIKDHRITTLAIGVIGLAAVVASIALLWQVFFPACAGGPDCSSNHFPEWPAETLRLALVASLAFVMGSGGSQSK